MRLSFALGLLAIVATSNAQSYIWVQENFNQVNTAFADNQLLFTGRDNVSASNGQWSVNTSRRLFVRQCIGAITNEPSWHPDVDPLQTPAYYYTYPLVGSGTYVTNVYWAISYTRRQTSETFQQYNINGPMGVFANREADERVNQTIWAYGV